MIVALIALMVTLSGSAYAVGRASVDEIHACRNTWSGALSIKDTCAAWEEPVSWNIQGTPGPRGARGERGARGTKGVKGTAGAAGAAGVAGSSGGGAGGQKVVDGNGRVIGDLVKIEAVTAVGPKLDVQIGRLVWTVDASTGTILDSGGGWGLNYTDAACSPAHAFYIWGNRPAMRDASLPYAPVVNPAGGVVPSTIAFDVPGDMTSVVVPAGATTYYRWGPAPDQCGLSSPADVDRYGTTAITPLTLPTFVPPLTVG